MLHSIWDLFQHHQISKADIKAENAKQLAITSGTSIANLQAQLDTLVLANHAMWELLSKKVGVSEKELVRLMNEIDLRDGIADGKISKAQIRQCSDCGHKIKKRRPNCYWCGSKINLETPFS